jgi:hypothetical protein
MDDLQILPIGGFSTFTHRSQAARRARRDRGHRPDHLRDGAFPLRAEPRHADVPGS